MMKIRRNASRVLGGAVLVAALAAPASASQPMYWDDGSPGAYGVTSATASPEECAVEVREVQDEMREQAINGRIALAKETYSVLPDGFVQLSCLERLLNGGADIFFKPPSIADLLGMLERAVCRQADQMFAQATAPLNRAANASLPLGEVIPGVNLGSLNGGVNMRVRGGNGGMVTTNLNSVLSGGPTYRRDVVYDHETMGGGLFGN